MRPFQSRVRFYKTLLDSTLMMHKDVSTLKDIFVEFYLDQQLYRNPKYADKKRLNLFEYKVFSQNGEDGILAEIFNRIGTTNRVFVEFGVGNGLENNTTYLLLNEWTGYWIERDSDCVATIQLKFASVIEHKRLAVDQLHLTAENVCEVFNHMLIPREFDLLSIDVDGNDYWIWRALQEYSPRVVVIEYNALLRPPVKFVVAYDPQKPWGGTSHYGASLKSLELLGAKKGYALVCCDFRGVNAFFVRRDLLGDKFLEPYTAENHYEPPRYHFVANVGNKRDFGDFECI